jgi:NAD(P)-dependent dehydrogenase (short-subunit alcohol dehydrogenase family)
MNNSAILSGKRRAVVFGAGGSIGAAVAKEFAAEGAEVFSAATRKRNRRYRGRGLLRGRGERRGRRRHRLQRCRPMAA